jgi:Tfp pilus assembly protein PilF
MSMSTSIPEDLKKLSGHDQRALYYEKVGDLDAAAKEYEAIVAIDPAWRGGQAMSELACCHEDLGNIELAREQHLKAIEIDSWNPMIVGNYTSFLYLNGEPEEALAQHLILGQLMAAQGVPSERTENLRPAVRALALRIGIAESDADARLDAALRRGWAGEFPEEGAGGTA